MTPGARISAAIECLDQIFSGIAAEKALTGWARKSRFAGSKDRAAVRDHVFDALRSRDSYAALGGGLNGRSVMIGLVRAQELSLEELFNGIGHAPLPLNDAESASGSKEWHWDLPDWCVEKLKLSYPNSAKEISNALKSRAPVDLRVNIRKTTRDQAQRMLSEEGITTSITAIASDALRIIENPRKLKLSQTYLDGFVELQDAGSQALVQTLPLKDRRKILDYCAGGGGKSLAMASATDASIFAHDIDSNRMKDIPLRAERADVKITCVETNSLTEHAPYDLVLCDAPCSGSGSWRRSPDAKWRMTETGFDELLKLQSEILKTARTLVPPDGYLSYATCSLFAEENEDQVNGFLTENPDFKLISQQSWTPLDECDGFFVASMQLSR